MNIILILACFAILCNAEFSQHNKDYLSVEQTSNLKGIFIMVVLFHHLNIFAGVGNIYSIFANAGYIAVGGFLFVSGYGLLYQYMHKGKDYVRSFPKRRIFTIIIPAVVMGVIYFIMKHVMDGYTVSNLIADFKRGSSVISNGWYVTAIIYFYITFYLASILSELMGKRKMIMIFSLGSTILYIYLCTRFNYEEHWFGAAFAFYYGMLWSFFKNKIDKNITKSVPIIIICLVGFYYMTLNYKYGWTQFKCLIYMTCIILAGMKIKLKSPFLEWLGTHSYEIYLVHGIFFGLLRNGVIYINDSFCFMLTVILMTFISAAMLHKFFGMISKSFLKYGK